MSKLPPVRIPCDGCTVVTGRKVEAGRVVVEGTSHRVHEGEWVDIVPVQSMEEYISLTSITGSNYQDVAEQVKAGEEGAEASLSEAGANVNRAFERMCEALSRRIINWNFTDLAGEPMPCPYRRPEVVRQLSIDEVIWLMGSTEDVETPDQRKKDSGASPATSSVEARSRRK